MVRIAFVPSANCDAGVMINGPISCVGCLPVAPSIPVAELAADGTVREISGVDVDVEARGVRLNLVGDSLGRLRAALGLAVGRRFERHHGGSRDTCRPAMNMGRVGGRNARDVDFVTDIVDRKSTRLNPDTNAKLVCRLLL